MKTLNVGLVLCLNIGVDPPDIIKTNPCSKLMCWVGQFFQPPPRAPLFFFFFARPTSGMPTVQLNPKGNTSKIVGTY
jgi:hypothetical protein